MVVVTPRLFQDVFKVLIDGNTFYGSFIAFHASADSVADNISRDVCKYHNLNLM